MADRVLGLDFGRRRIGIAVSDGLGLTAQPHSVVDLESEDLASALMAVVTEYGIKTIVVGLPVSLAGTEGEVARDAREFAAEVAEITGLEVELYNEQYTSAVAERVLLESGARRSQRKAVRDKLAAAVMLQGYLEARS